MPGATPAKTACFLEHHADREARLSITVNRDFGAPTTQAGGPSRLDWALCILYIPLEAPPTLGLAHPPGDRGRAPLKVEIQ